MGAPILDGGGCPILDARLHRVAGWGNVRGSERPPPFHTGKAWRRIANRQASDTLVGNMCHRRLLALSLLLPLIAAAQTPTYPIDPPRTQPATSQTPPSTPPTPDAAVPTTPSTTIPSDSNCRARPTWCQSARDRIAAAKGHPVDILFVGDSITEGWTSIAWGGVHRGAAVWDKVYAPRNALNFGVGADATQNVLWRLDTMDVRDLTPKVTVLLIGTNNTHDTAADIAAGVHAILTKLQTMYPATRIILVSVLPNARATALMADVNALIQTFADDRTIFYFDLGASMPPVGDNWLGLGPDKLHPDQSGYQIWADAMEPLLTRLLTLPQPAQ